jgi:hypothetical protein
MALSVEQINEAADDNALYALLKSELLRLFPMWLLKKPAAFRRRREAAPPGMRAMAATYDLDVSLALDDLAWHFVNHPALWENEETLWALGELGQPEAVRIFGQALEFMRPRLSALVAKTKEWNERADTHTESHGRPMKNARFLHDWLKEVGIDAHMDTLTRDFWALVKPEPMAVLSWWLKYARRNPERCVGGKGAVFWQRFTE